MAGLDVVSLGEPMYEFSQIPGMDGRQYLQGFGGDTMNCIIAAARQGAKTAYLTRLGDDAFGREMLALWREEGIDTAGVGVDNSAHTAVYFISHDASGHVFSYLRKGSAASRMRPADLPAGLIESARAAGARFVYDANLRPRLWPRRRAAAVIAATIPLADYFLLSMEDAEALCGLYEPRAILDWCHRAGAAAVALKLGAEGVIASDTKRVETLAGHKVDCIDATGAGDCFAGALMARMAAGEDFWEALRYANAAAALTTTGYGAIAPLPRPGAVNTLLRASS